LIDLIEIGLDLSDFEKERSPSFTRLRLDLAEAYTGSSVVRIGTTRFFHRIWGRSVHLSGIRKSNVVYVTKL